MSVSRTLLVALAVWTGALAPPAHSAADGATALGTPRGEESEPGDVEEPAERSGGSLPGAIGWVALGMGLALIIVMVGLSNAETVYE